MSARSALVRAMPCIACVAEQDAFDSLIGYVQPQPTEEHHLNLGGKAGQKRRGDDCSIPLCGWHHRGEPPVGMTASQAAFHHGPSLARSSRKFRELYGTDDELLTSTDELIKRGLIRVGRG